MVKNRRRGPVAALGENGAYKYRKGIVMFVELDCRAEAILLKADRIVYLKEDEDGGVIALTEVNTLPFYFTSESFYSAKAKLANDKNFIEVKGSPGRYLVNLRHIVGLESIQDDSVLIKKLRCPECESSNLAECENKTGYWCRNCGFFPIEKQREGKRKAIIHFQTAPGIICLETYEKLKKRILQRVKKELS